MKKQKTAITILILDKQKNIDNKDLFYH